MADETRETETPDNHAATLQWLNLFHAACLGDEVAANDILLLPVPQAAAALAARIREQGARELATTGE
jgi:hypothetical protein